MFGRNKVTAEEIEKMQETLAKNEEFFKQFLDIQEVFEGDCLEIKESQSRNNANIKQLEDNIISAAEYAKQNIEGEATLIYALDECSKQMAESEKEIAMLKEAINDQAQSSMKLVDDNKHFTTPSKIIVEAPGTLRSTNLEFKNKLNDLTGFSKQMGVLALNAAIEAGRMGDAGMQFVAAAQGIKDYSVNYDKTVFDILRVLELSDVYISKLEEQIHHLVGLLKENNVETSKLMKMCSETAKEAKNSNDREFSKDILSLKDGIVGIKNYEEEILKLEERNKMQISDVMEEVDTQTNSSQEIEDKMGSLFAGAKHMK